MACPALSAPDLAADPAYNCSRCNAPRTEPSVPGAGQIFSSLSHEFSLVDEEPLTGVSEKRLPRRRVIVTLGAMWAALLAMPVLLWATDPGSRLAQAELVERLNAGQAPMLVDVRTPDEYRNGHVPGAINIPVQELERRVDELGPYRETELVLYCESGVRAGHAERMLQRLGFTQLRSLDGHMRAWRSAGLPAEQ